MYYTRRVGECEETFEGTPEEIIKIINKVEGINESEQKEAKLAAHRFLLLNGYSHADIKKLENEKVIPLVVASAVNYFQEEVEKTSNDKEFRAGKIPLEVDVWKEIEGYLKTGFKDILRLRYDYSADKQSTTIHISHPKDDKIVKEKIELGAAESDELVMLLCKRFNIPSHNLYGLFFTLNATEVPTFSIRLWPYVDDESTLDKSKSRFEPLTID